MNVSDGSATMYRIAREYDDTVQMRLFVMHGTAMRDERN
jgi:hypothetical protein